MKSNTESLLFKPGPQPTQFPVISYKSSFVLQLKGKSANISGSKFEFGWKDLILNQSVALTNIGSI